MSMTMKNLESAVQLNNCIECLSRTILFHLTDTSKNYEGQDPLVLTRQAERDLNSHGAKHGLSSADSDMLLFQPIVLLESAIDKHQATESGVDTNVTQNFPDSTVKVGSAASGAGDNREMPVDEGGDLITKPGDKSGCGQYVKKL